MVSEIQQAVEKHAPDENVNIDAISRLARDIESGEMPADRIIH